MWQGWVNGILGAWIFISAFFTFAPRGNMWNDIIVGVVTAIVGFLMVKERPWQGWLTGLLGIWLIIAGFIPGLQMHTGNLWNHIIVGVLMMIGGFGALTRGSGTHAPAH